MAKLTLSDIEVKNKRVLMRVDFNVPRDEKGEVTDDFRIVASLPSIKHVIEKGGKLILMAHLERPKGVDEKLRLNSVAKRLSELLGKPVKKLNDCIGPEVEKAVSAMQPGDVIMLENVRFHPEEEKNDDNFGAQLARLGDVYVNDGFSVAHRAQASVVAVTKHIPVAVAGFSMKAEIEALTKLLTNPEKPFIVILGGAKVSDKIGVIKNLLGKVDALLICGAMSFAFLKAKGAPTGKSKLEESDIPIATEVIEEAKKINLKLLLPLDLKIVADVEVGASTIPADWKGLDIGPKTIESFSSEIRSAKTIFWNGPAGKFEDTEFCTASKAIAKLIAESSAFTVIGGGDTIAAVRKAGELDKVNYLEKISHVSTGGGATLEFLAGIELPGIKALTDK